MNLIPYSHYACSARLPWWKITLLTWIFGWAWYPLVIWVAPPGCILCTIFCFVFCSSKDIWVTFLAKKAIRISSMTLKTNIKSRKIHSEGHSSPKQDQGPSHCSWKSTIMGSNVWWNTRFTLLFKYLFFEVFMHQPPLFQGLFKHHFNAKSTPLYKLAIVDAIRARMLVYGLDMTLA